MLQRSNSSEMQMSQCLLITGIQRKVGLTNTASLHTTEESWYFRMQQQCLFMFCKKIFLNGVLLEVTVAFEWVEVFPRLRCQIPQVNLNPLWKSNWSYTEVKRLCVYCRLSRFYFWTVGQGADRAITYLNKLCDCNSNAQQPVIAHACFARYEMYKPNISDIKPAYFAPNIRN